MRRWQVLMIMLWEAAAFLAVIHIRTGLDVSWWGAAAAYCAAAASFLPLPATRYEGGEGQ